MATAPTASAPETSASTSRDRLLTVVVASSGLFLVALDFSINVSLPTMRDSLGASLISVQGIIIFYHASRSGLAPAAGGLGDSFGLRRVFLWGVVAYTVAVGLISLQDSLGAIIGLRVLQGVGAAVLFTTGPALVVRAFGRARRGTALGVTLASVSAGQLTATLGGGFLSEAIGWEAIFYARVPIGLAVLAIGLFALSRDPRKRDLGNGGRRFDWSGAAVLYGALFALVAVISFARLDGLLSGLVIGLAVLTALLFAGFNYLQRRARWPVLPRGLWSAPGFAAGGVSNVLVFVASFLTWFLFPFFVTDVLGRGALAIGAMLAVVAGASTAGSIIGGWLADRIGDRVVTAAGAAVTAVGLLWIAGLDAEVSLPGIAVRVGLAGAGFGLHQAAVYSLAMRRTRPDHAGAGSAVMAVAQTIGAPLSITFGMAIFTWREDLALRAGIGATDAFVGAFHDAYLAAAVVAVLAGLVVVTVRRRGA
ncbi:MAG: MFS transporter [Chloroflexi bacterium]|nr:MFS transporter [Chloroflexota bacterium]